MRKLIIYFRDGRNSDKFNLDLAGDDDIANNDGLFSVMSRGSVFGYPLDTIQMYTLTEE